MFCTVLITKEINILLFNFKLLRFDDLILIKTVESCSEIEFFIEFMEN